MLVSKTIKCGIVNPTKTKLNLLEQEYENLQRFLHGDENVKLYSANKQQAKRYYKKIKPNRAYPLSVRKDLVKVKRKETKLVKYWVRIPVAGRRGGVWLPVKPHCEFPESYEICESKVLKRNGRFFIHITIKKEVEIKTSYSSVLAIDIGERVIATAVLSVEKRPRFYGRDVRGIRRHFAWLRKRLGERKLLKVIKRMGHKERRAVDDRLHKISRELVRLAHQHNALILLGDLKGIRSSAKGKRFNKIVNSMPYYKLTKYIEYKANWLGIKVVKVKENGTSKTCLNAGVRGRDRTRDCSCATLADTERMPISSVLKTY